MKLTVYRAHDAFVVSPDCMQAPMAVQQAHPAKCECGELDLPADALAHVERAIMREGFALVGRSDRAAYEALDRLCVAFSGGQLA
jgi:hypothetical protein